MFALAWAHEQLCTPMRTAWTGRTAWNWATGLTVWSIDENADAVFASDMTTENSFTDAELRKILAVVHASFIEMVNKRNIKKVHLTSNRPGFTLCLIAIVKVLQQDFSINLTSNKTPTNCSDREDKSLNKKEGMLRKKAETLRKKEETLQTKEETLQTKAETLQKKEETLQTKEETLQTKAEMLRKKEEGLRIKEQHLTEREKRLVLY